MILWDLCLLHFHTCMSVHAETRTARVSDSPFSQLRCSFGSVQPSVSVGDVIKQILPPSLSSSLAPSFSLTLCVCVCLCCCLCRCCSATCDFQSPLCHFSMSTFTNGSGGSWLESQGVSECVSCDRLVTWDGCIPASSSPRNAAVFSSTPCDPLIRGLTGNEGMEDRF